MSDTSTDKAPVIKKEWYCTLPKYSDERSLSLGAPITAGAFWALCASVCFLIGEPAAEAAPVLLRGLIIIAAYMLIWSAFFMRRREVKK